MSIKSKTMYWVLAIVYGLFVLSLQKVHAAPITFTAVRLSTPVSNAYSNYTIAFRSVSGMSSGSITIDVSQVASSFANLGYQDIDLMYGATQATLGAAAADGVWGVSIDSTAKSIAFTYPTANGTAIAAGTIVIIKIGNHTTYQSIGSVRMVNTGGLGAQNIAISAGIDSGNATVTLVSAVTPNTQMVNGAAGNSKIITIIAGNDSGTLAIPLLPEDSIAVSAARQNRGTVVGGIFAPTNLSAVSNKENEVLLTWKDNSTIERGYIIERKNVSAKIPEDYREIGLTTENIQEYVDKSVDSETTYEYRIRAFNEVFLSNYSIAIVTTIKKAYVAFPLLPPPPTVYVPPKPQVPSTEQPREIPIPSNVSSLSGNASDATVELRWINPRDPELAYIQIQWSDIAFPQSPDDGVTVMKKMAEFFVDKGLENGKPSFYTVFAVNSYGKYSSGAYTVHTPLEPPRPLSLPSIPTAPQPISSPHVQPAAPSTSQGHVSPPVPAQDSGTAIEQLKPVTITLDRTVTKEFQSEARATITAKNIDSTKEINSLTVDIPPKTIDGQYQVSISPRSLDQVKLLDDQTLFPIGKIVPGEIFYQVQLRQKGDIVKKFAKSVVLRFKYGKTLSKAVDEKTLKAHYWDAQTKSWIPVDSEVDTVKKEVRATVKHFTVYTLIGEPSPALKATKKNPYTVVTRTDISKPKPVTFQLQDILERVANTSMTGSKLVVERSGTLRLCVSEALFQNKVLSMTAQIGTSRYLLVPDETAKCFTGNLIAPSVLGVYPFTIKVVYGDDVVQTKEFTLEVIDQHIQEVAPVGVKETAELSPMLAFLLGDAILLCLIATGVLFTITRRIFESGEKRS
ncbi:hypothetical protein HY620_01740 [Candidatus Uhrbacteria bacterium]|nr:hypothetical protein [Candidatus Uhrbacteria bacterium]